MPADKMLHNVTSADASRLDVIEGDAMKYMYAYLLVCVNPLCDPKLIEYLYNWLGKH